MTVRKTKILFLIICTLQLFYLFNFRSGFRYEIIKDPFNENSGISYAVSSEVIESRDILKKYEATRFNLSKKLKDDVYFYQRSLEFNYPIRINQSSKFVFFSINEDISEKCKVIETGKYLKLTQC
jgi:hypothetical protein|tara:strand:+ start:71 stop:445 length:375 start_codon:yes stop_codon:yes gene_type:complete